MDLVPEAGDPNTEGGAVLRNGAGVNVVCSLAFGTETWSPWVDCLALSPTAPDSGLTLILFSHPVRAGEVAARRQAAPTRTLPPDPAGMGLLPARWDPARDQL